MISNAQKVFELFKSRMEQAIKDHKELVLAVHEKRRQASLESILVEQFVMSIAVKWEDFLNNLILSYISTRPTKFMKDMRDRIKQSNIDKFGISVANRISFSIPSNVSTVLVQSFIDPKGWNVTPTLKEGITGLANKYLHAKDAKKFSLGANDLTFIEFVRCLRNYLSHQSRNSRDSLKEANSSLNRNDKTWPIIRRFSYLSVCHYLKNSTDTEKTRATEIALKLIEIANKLV